MPAHRDGGPRTSTGHVAFPTGVDNPVFAEGDLVWVDAGVGFCGYMSDFGRTWVAGRDPNPAEQSLFDRWMAVLEASLAVVRPGATLGDIGRAARAVEPEETPWLPQFYLAHGTGLESAEMPMIGTDLGPASMTATSWLRGWCWSSSRSSGPTRWAATGPRRSWP